LHRARKRLTNALRFIDNPSEGRVPASHPGTAHSVIKEQT